MQSFTNLVKYGTDSAGRLEVAECTEYPNGIESKFIEDISHRTPTVSLSLRIMTGLSEDSWFGLDLSPNEYQRIHKMIKLFPAHQEYLKLSKYNE